MKNIILLTICILSAAITSSANAKNMLEVSAGQIDVSDLDTEFVQLAYAVELSNYPVSIQVRLGAAVDDLERETNLGLGGGAIAALGITSTLNETVEDLRFGSLLASSEFSLSERLSLYGLAGYSQISANVSTTGSVNGLVVVDASLGEVDGSSFSYGGGLRLNVTDGFSIKAEYFALNSDINTLSLGLAWHF